MKLQEKLLSINRQSIKQINLRLQNSERNDVIKSHSQFGLIGKIAACTLIALQTEDSMRFNVVQESKQM